MPPERLEPHVVQRAAFKPGKCAVTADIDGPFLDTAVKYENRGYWHKLYLHLPWIAEMARKHCGMVERSEQEALKEEIKMLEEDRDALQMAFDALSGAKEEVPA